MRWDKKNEKYETLFSLQSFSSYLWYLKTRNWWFLRQFFSYQIVFAYDFIIYHIIFIKTKISFIVDKFYTSAWRSSFSYFHPYKNQGDIHQIVSNFCQICLFWEKSSNNYNINEAKTDLKKHEMYFLNKILFIVLHYSMLYFHYYLLWSIPSNDKWHICFYKFWPNFSFFKLC